MDIYLSIDGQQIGPFTEEVVRQKFTDGEVTGDTLMWKEGMADWAPIFLSLNITDCHIDSTDNLAMATDPGLQARTLQRQNTFLKKIKSETALGRFAFPCWELILFEECLTERPDWPQRWAAAGGRFYANGRMIAAKSDPVWQALGEGKGGYTDTLGKPYPPFVFGSGMSCVDISREEALELGVITPDDDVIPPDSELAAGLRKDAADIRANDPELYNLIFGNKFENS